MTRRLTAVALAALALAALGACANADAHPAPTAATAPAPSLPSTAAEAAYLAALRVTIPADTIGDGTALSLGEQACADFTADPGTTLDDVTRRGAERGMGPEDAATVAGAAAAYLCPQHADLWGAL